ncbi:MAG: NAD-dependent epimerase/dehydratase family protein, partial [Bradymonadaceae bacterium]
ALCRELLGRGYRVRALGRTLEKGQELGALGADFRPVDLEDSGAMMHVMKGVDVVVHAGALASPWASDAEFEAVNVGGTQNVIDACRKHHVSRLVYVSSPSVMSRFEDQFELKESDPLPEEFVSAYSRTKWQGEELVRKAANSGLETVIIRPKAVYGPGDTTILPRIIAAAKKRAFPKFGDGKAVTNITFIDDVVEGLCLAIESAAAVGNTYVLAGEEVVLLDLVRGVLERLGHEVADRSLNVNRAMAIGAGAEAIYKRLAIRGEPPLTRYTVGLFSYSQTYDISAARKDLGFEPKVGAEEGVERYFEALEKRDPRAPVSTKTKKPVGVECSVFSAGKCTAFEFTFRPEDSTEVIDIPALVGLFHHPKEGVILFDTGFSERYFEATETFPASLYRLTIPAIVDRDTEALGRVRALGIDPADVGWILLSHFDPDHYGGLKDFPNARIVCTAEAWESVRGKTGIDALKVRVLPGHLPEDLSARLTILPKFEDQPIGPFSVSHDLFGDGSIRLVDLPGHAAGQYGAFVRRSGGDTVFFAADGCWSRRCLYTDPPRPRLHRYVAADRVDQDETYKILRRLHLEMPEVPIIPSHCPDAAADFDVLF